MKRWCLSLLLLAASCGPREPAPSSPPAEARPLPVMQGTQALAEVAAFLKVGPRIGGTEGARRAAGAIKDRLEAQGVPAELQRFGEITPDGSNTFINVVATIPGGKPGLVIVGAHYDTKSGIAAFDGANDSGSGVGVLLALAPLLKRASDRLPTVRLAFFDGEECRQGYGPHDGLHGSRYMAGELARTGEAGAVRAFILLDMVGDRDLTVTLPRNGTPDLMARVFTAAEELGVRRQFSLFPGGMLDDHQPFLEKGIPAVDLIDFEYGSAPGLNDYWHTSADTLDKLSAASLGTVGNVVLRVLASLAGR